MFESRWWRIGEPHMAKQREDAVAERRRRHYTSLVGRLPATRPLDASDSFRKTWRDALRFTVVQLPGNLGVRMHVQVPCYRGHGACVPGNGCGAIGCAVQLGWADELRGIRARGPCSHCGGSVRVPWLLPCGCPGFVLGHEHIGWGKSPCVRHIAPRRRAACEERGREGPLELGAREP
jgi:hypothetical protein